MTKFGEMMGMLREGFVMARAGWPRRLYLEMESGEVFQVHGDPAELSRTPHRKLWKPQDGDLAAVDWKVAESKR